MISKAKYMFNTVYAVFSLPALLIHEVCHIVTGFLCGYYFSYNESRFIWNQDGSTCFLLWEKNHKKTLFKSIVVSLSPLYFVVAVAIMALFYSWCRYMLVYLMITYKYSLPSPGDWDKIRYHKLFKKHLDNHRAMTLFFHLKGYYKDQDDEEEIDILPPD